MFFYLSKILWFFAVPSNAMLLLLLAGIIMLWSRWARTGRRVVLIAGLLLLVTGLTPVGHALILPLEERFARADLSNGPPPDGIVVLGGGQDMSITAARGVVALNEGGERVAEAVLLARRFPGARLVFSGGSGELFGAKIPEAQGAASLFARLGIERARFVLEDRSRNTHENALYSKKLAAPRPGERWILVTSASHMPRSVGSFRAAGFPVEPWPVDYRTHGWRDLRWPFSKASEGWRRVDNAVREWIGLLAYRMTGRTDRLFPEPD